MKINYKFLLIILVVVFLVPQVALAAWWNPFSWGIWNRIFHFQRTEQQQDKVVCTMDAKLCPDGSSVGREGPKCEFKACPEIKDKTATWKKYTNTKYGFEIKLPDSWGNYVISNQNRWEGVIIDAPGGDGSDYSGPMVFIKNPTLEKKFRFVGIPIMVITPEVWKLISEEKVSVSAAPIGPGKIGENEKYVFATPPRYIGFGDDLNTEQIEEVYKIVETFKALKPTDETVGWKTYTNTQYGFEIKYPSNDWSLLVDTPNPTPNGRLLYEMQIGANSTESYDFVGSVQLYIQSGNVDSWLSNKATHTRETVYINGLRAEKFYFGRDLTTDNSRTYVFERNNLVYVFNTAVVIGNKYGISETDISQILSTFKFTK